MNSLKFVLAFVLVAGGTAYGQNRGFTIGLTSSADAYHHRRLPDRDDHRLSFKNPFNASGGVDASYVGKHFFLTGKVLYSTKRVMAEWSIRPRQEVLERIRVNAQSLTFPVYAGYVYRRANLLLMPGAGVVFESLVFNEEKTFNQAGEDISGLIFRLPMVNRKATALSGTLGIGYAFNRVLLKVEPSVRRYPQLLSSLAASGSTSFHLPITVSVVL